MAFLLRPTESGWWIDVRDERGTESLTLWTTPWRGPTPCDLAGWHFRNSDNTGPNESGPKNVNAPQTTRAFVFSREIGRSIPGAGGLRKPTAEEQLRLREGGTGTLEIVDYDLTGLKPGGRARFSRLEFRVQLTWKR